MKAITIRGIDPNVDTRLKQTASEQGKSVNQLILEIIRKSLGMEKEKTFSREYSDLDDLFGKWNDEEYDAVQGKIDRERVIDRELWE